VVNSDLVGWDDFDCLDLGRRRREDDLLQLHRPMDVWQMNFLELGEGRYLYTQESRQVLLLCNSLNTSYGFTPDLRA
jgi:hypothetical protein